MILSARFFLDKERSLTRRTVLWFLLLLVCAGLYVFSFSSGLLAVSLLAGVGSTLLCVLTYFGFLYKDRQLIRFYKDSRTGLTQTDEYTFRSFGDMTEHDGVLLREVVCSFADADGETFSKTLYYLSELPLPALEEGQKLSVKTYRGVILEAEVKA